MAACLPGIHNLFSPWLYKNRHAVLNSQESGSQSRIRPSSGNGHKHNASVASHAYTASNTTPGYASPRSELDALSSPKFNSAKSSVRRYGADENDLDPAYDNDDEIYGHYNNGQDDQGINMVGMNRTVGQRNTRSHLVHELSDGVERWSFVPSHNGG